MNRRFALIQALVSLVALAAVVWWATKQESPHIPTGGDAIAWIVAGVGLYVLATLVRAERWHQILEHAGVRAKRVDCYALTTVGYMGNNVLPARAGEALRVVLLAPRCNASKRTLISSIVAERVLDVIALLIDLRRHGLRRAQHRGGAAHGQAPARDGDRRSAGAGRPRWRSGSCAATTSSSASATGCARSPTRRARWSRAGASCSWRATFLLWTIEASVYWSVARAVEMDISISGALYLVALTNFVAALPAAPGSLGTFDAAVAWGAHRLGATGSVAVSYVILIRFVLYVPITIVGLVVLVTRYGGWSRLRSATRLEASRA